MRLKIEKIIVGTATLAGILSIPIVFRSTEKNLPGCETYQGYRNGSEGEVFFYFDKQTLEERGSRKPIALQGDPEWVDENRLEIGQSYRLQIKEGLLTKRLVSFQPCIDSEQEIQSSK